MFFLFWHCFFCEKDTGNQKKKEVMLCVGISVSLFANKNLLFPSSLTALQWHGAICLA